MVVMMDIEISCKGHCGKLSLSRPCEPYCTWLILPIFFRSFNEITSVIYLVCIEISREDTAHLQYDTKRKERTPVP